MTRKMQVLRYVGFRLGILLLALLLLTGVFFSSMKTASLYFMLQDAMKARLDMILLRSDDEKAEGFFSESYLETREYSALRDKYIIYHITNYGYQLNLKNTFVWPWQTRKSVTVQEAVYSINGELDTSVMSKADAKAAGVADVPDWENNTYRVTLVYSGGKWLIDRITVKSRYNWKPAETHYLPAEEIDALRTAAPTEAPTPAPTEEGATPAPMHDSATISTAIAGTTVNVRTGPSTGYAIVRELKGGDKVTVIGQSDNWYRVILADGTEGYVSKVYIAFD